VSFDAELLSFSSDARKISAYSDILYNPFLLLLAEDYNSEEIKNIGQNIISKSTSRNCTIHL